MWPFTADVPSAWLGLYLVTLALHVVLIGYVVGGTGYALIQAVRRRTDPTAERARDLLPFMLGLGITAGVAPLLFLQLLYQRSFYTANLILGPRWGAIVPALIVGFYALYLAKATVRSRRRIAAFAVALACFVFVAWSWTELHLLMQAEPAWRVMYAAGDRLFDQAGVLPRLLLWLGAMVTAFAVVSAWWATGAERRALAVLAIAGRAVSAVAVGLLVLGDAAIVSQAHGWLYILGGALVVELAGWAWMWRRPEASTPLMLVTAAGTAALLAGVVVREAPRLALLDPPRTMAIEAGGAWVFVVTAILGVAVIGWIVRVTRSAR